MTVYHPHFYGYISIEEEDSVAPILNGKRTVIRINGHRTSEKVIQPTDFKRTGETGSCSYPFYGSNRTKLRRRTSLCCPEQKHVKDPTYVFHNGTASAIVKVQGGKEGDVAFWRLSNDGYVVVEDRVSGRSYSIIIRSGTPFPCGP